LYNFVAAREDAVRRDRNLGGFRHESTGNKARAAMNETPGPETGSQFEAPVRKPWHAPRLSMTDLAATYASIHAKTDTPITVGTSQS
jgi:hypothetical protein